jgi:hypothetical protein
LNATYNYEELLKEVHNKFFRGNTNHTYIILGLSKV